MASEVGVLIIHGMGSQQPDFAVGLIKKLLEILGDKADKVCFEPVYWAPLLAEKEAEVWRNLSAGSDMDWVKLRKFVLNALGDATAYRYIPGEYACTYYQIHDKVYKGLKRLKAGLASDNKPLIIIAHSLGAAIMSNYIWDRQNGKDGDRYGSTPFEKMQTLSGLLTFGCNIPLFVLAYEKIECITFPPKELDIHLKGKAKWLNFFDSDDILGWPLKRLSEGYDKAVTADHEINVGGMFSSWNPVSHSEYWTDKNFTERAAKLIGEFV